MRRPIGAKSKIVLVLFLSFSLVMLVYRFGWMYRGTKWSGSRAARVLAVTPKGLNPSQISAPMLFKVKQVIDGDTVLLSDGSLVRYIGVDTPERDQPAFEDATRSNRAKLEGNEVDVRVCDERRVDKYGRRLAMVSAEGRDVALELVREGLGRVFVDQACMTKELLDRYFQASIEAYRQRLGMWSSAAAGWVPVGRAAQCIGKSCVICGEIKNVFRGPQAVHVNFGEDYKTDFSATVFYREETRFGEAGIALDTSLVGKKVLLFGRVVEHEGANMVISSPVQWKSTDDCSKGM